MRTKQDLLKLQSLPLDLKVRLTQQRIKQWVDEYGIDNVFVSFSGGKDSTVLLHIARQMYPRMKAVYSDTGLQYPELRQFVSTFDNVDWVVPKLGFKQVIEQYGYPFISKQASQCIQGSRKYYEKLIQNGIDVSDKTKLEIRKDIPFWYSYEKLTKTGSYSEDKKSPFSFQKWQFLMYAPFVISNRCCYMMKKSPMHTYTTKSKRKPITAEMACQSRLRTQKWLQYGCNMFKAKNPISKPMSFWMKQDILQYIKQNNINICSVYGDIIQQDGYYKTTGCQRTGCCMCGFGLHLETRPNRLELINKLSNPNITEYILKGGMFDKNGLWKPSKQGLGYWFVIKYINTYGDVDIYIPNYEQYQSQYGNQITKRYLKNGK